MRILISSLQVSKGASKGHLHPAIEIGLELKRRGHEVGILPLPNPFDAADREQVIRCGFEVIEPPLLPAGLPLPPEELGRLAKNPSTTWKAYYSFLMSPLEYQFENVIEKIKNFNPDIVVYDLLVYAAPLAARLLDIPDLGFCAGLKLAAPSELTVIYKKVYDEILPAIRAFLKHHSLAAEFHNLELLSTSFQLVFTPENFINTKTLPRGTKFVGSLPISASRCESDVSLVSYPKKDFIVLSFGSVFDPVKYQVLTQLVINAARKFKQHIVISTNYPEAFEAADITTAAYLPLPQLLKNASIFIHHGGANSFSESLSIGIPQILIPLATDQPIQAEILKASQAGIAIYPEEMSEEKLYQAFQQLLDKSHSIHAHIQTIKELFANSKGEVNAANLVEETLCVRC